VCGGAGIVVQVFVVAWCVVGGGVCEWCGRGGVWWGGGGGRGGGSGGGGWRFWEVRATNKKNDWLVCCLNF